MDTDTTHKRGTHENVLRDFKEHKIDVLIGTQMIAKGLDFPKVTLVGVVSADTALNLPDFRSAERTFNLLTQVGGRAGRSDLGGRVIIQTYAPHHYAIKTAKYHDYHTFYAKEISLRKELNLPPFTHMASITFKGKKEEGIIKLAGEVRERIEAEDKLKKISILGPAPAPISKIKGNYIWKIFLKGNKVETVISILHKILSRKLKKGIKIIVDIDPY